MSEKELPEVVERGQRGRARTIFECGLVDSVSYWTKMPIIVLLFNLLSRLLLCMALALALPAEIIDFLWVYLVVLSVQWVLVLGFFSFGLNNILLMLSLLVWLLVLPVGRLVIGARAVSPSLWMRMPEYFISFLVFVEFLGLIHHVLMTACRIFIHMQVTSCCLGIDERNHRRARGGFLFYPLKFWGDVEEQIGRWVRLAHVYFFGHQLHTLQAYIVLLTNLTTSLLIAFLDKVCCRVHTWWLLNYELARTDNREQYLQNKPTLLEQESQRHGHQIAVPLRPPLRAVCCRRGAKVAVRPARCGRRIRSAHGRRRGPAVCCLPSACLRPTWRDAIPEAWRIMPEGEERCDGGEPNVPSIYTELEQRSYKRMQKVSVRAMLLCCFVYLLMGAGKPRDGAWRATAPPGEGSGSKHLLVGSKERRTCTKRRLFQLFYASLSLVRTRQ
eukprot:g4045.t1